jgi:predicted deacylase
MAGRSHRTVSHHLGKEFDVITARKETEYLETQGPNGDEIRIPVGRVAGVTDGPSLVIVGGVHGAEYAGIEAVRRIFSWIDPNSLAGRVATIPCLNVPAFYGFAAHVNPVDGENPARAFPGASDGSYTERMVHLAWDGLIGAADYIVDVHGGDIEEELVDYSQINLSGDERHDARAVSLGLALDMPFFVRRAAPIEPVRSKGTICQIASSEGIPSALAEAGSHAELDESSVNVHLKGLRNVLYHLRMLRGVPTIENPKPLLLHRFAGIAAPCEGFWYPVVKKGDVITKGQAVGEIRDFFGNPLATIISEENAAILGVMTVPARAKGDMLMGLGTLD